MEVEKRRKREREVDEEEGEEEEEKKGQNQQKLLEQQWQAEYVLYVMKHYELVEILKEKN